MRTCWIQFKREIGAIMLSPIAYVMLVALTLMNAFSFQYAAYILTVGVPNFSIMQIFFQIFFFWFILILAIPILTMRLFSEEYKTGTVEMLLTSPVREWEIVLAKFFGVLAFYVVLWLPTLVFYGVFQFITKNQIPVNWPALGLGYAIVVLIGMFYLSIGLFTSALTKNQIVAAISSFTIIALIFFAGFLNFRTTDPKLLEMVTYISARSHTMLFGSGIFDSRPVVFYLSGTILFLFFTERALAARKLKA